MGEAAKSNIEKRKVGCIIVDAMGTIIAKGHNDGLHHAEANALHEVVCKPTSVPMKAYISHQPCPTCAELLWKAGIDDIEVVEAFMKFDGDKLRYDLIPPSTMKALAEVLTFGARKYKPNNWKECADTDRYIAALYRHLEAWRAGEEKDEESGMPHLWHAITNLAFLVELR